jgi:hypothetical protein
MFHLGSGYSYHTFYHHSVEDHVTAAIIAFILVFGLLIFFCYLCSSVKDDTENHQHEDLESILDMTHNEIIEEEIIVEEFITEPVKLAYAYKQDPSATT